MKLHGFRQKGYSRSLRAVLGALTVTLAGSVSYSATNQVMLSLPTAPASNICTFEGASEWKASLSQLIESQNFNSERAKETLFGYYIPEIAKLVQSLPDSEKEHLASNIMVWLTPENFERGLDLKARSSEALSPEEISQLISFEACWQSLLGYVLTLNPDYRNVEDINIISRPNFFNETFRDVERVDRNRYLVFLVNGTIKLSEIIRSAKMLMTLAQKQGNQVCVQIPSSQGYLEKAQGQ